MMSLVLFPEGTIIQIVRGTANWVIRLFIEFAFTAPFPTTVFDAEFALSYTITRWPPWSKRSTIAAPMRPIPIKPISIYTLHFLR